MKIPGIIKGRISLGGKERPATESEPSTIPKRQLRITKIHGIPTTYTIEQLRQVHEVWAPDLGEVPIVKGLEHAIIISEDFKPNKSKEGTAHEGLLMQQELRLDELEPGTMIGLYPFTHDGTQTSHPDSVYTLYIQRGEGGENIVRVWRTMQEHMPTTPEQAATAPERGQGLFATIDDFVDDVLYNRTGKALRRIKPGEVLVMPYFLESEDQFIDATTGETKLFIKPPYNASEGGQIYKPGMIKVIPPSETTGSNT